MHETAPGAPAAPTWTGPIALEERMSGRTAVALLLLLFLGATVFDRFVIGLSWSGSVLMSGSATISVAALMYAMHRGWIHKFLS
jgi:hypothetical protein